MCYRWSSGPLKKKKKKRGFLEKKESEKNGERLPVVQNTIRRGLKKTGNYGELL